MVINLDASKELEAASDYTSYVIYHAILNDQLLTKLFLVKEYKLNNVYRFSG